MNLNIRQKKLLSIIPNKWSSAREIVRIARESNVFLESRAIWINLYKFETLELIETKKQDKKILWRKIENENL